VSAMRSISFIIFLLAGCASFPDLDGTISDTLRDAPYPPLTPIPVAPTASADETDALNARVAALQARAEQIRQIEIGALQ